MEFMHLLNMFKTQLYIDGKWVNSSSGETFDSVNPATEEVLSACQKASKEDAKKAIDAASMSQEKWSDIPPPKRGQILFKVAELLRKNKEKLAELETNEMGKVLEEARGDVQEAIDIFEYMAAEGRRLFGRTTTSELKDKFCMSIRRPIGVVGLISPWNFSIAIPAWKLAPALICGNSVVFKPSSETPLCAVELVKILEQAGIPPGVVNLVTGSGEEVGGEIVRNKKTLGVSFTGSRDTGKWITENARIKKISLELGGKNCTIIMDDADLNLALEGCIWGGFGTTGQRCTATSRIIISEKIKSKFQKAIVERAKKLKLGYGLKKGVDVGPLVNKKALEKTCDYVDIGKNEGAKLLTGGSPLKGKGFFHQPTVFDGSPEMSISQEEIFGPVVTLLGFKKIEEAIEIANGIEYGLSSSIYTQDIRNAFKAIEKLDTGITYVNAPTIGAEVHLPFGGVKQTGSGREAGWTGIDEFSEEKAVYIDYSGKLQRAQIDV